MIRFKMVNMHADFVFVLFSNGTDVRTSSIAYPNLYSLF